MKDLRLALHEIVPRVLASPSLAILTDFDGTLTPIVDHPDHARLSARGRRALRALTGGPWTVVGVVSGRRLRDLVRRVGLKGIWYVGTHGFEIRSPLGETERCYTPEEEGFMAGVAEEIEEATSSVKGVYCEPKGPSVAVHFRKVPLRQRPEVDRALLRILVRHHPRVILARGLQVVEARLRLPVSKGTAVRRMCRDLPEAAAVLYFGDDETDRDAFREVVGRGWRVAVGGLSGPADYTLPGPDAVIEVLEALSRLTSNVPGPGGDRNPPKIR